MPFLSSSLSEQERQRLQAIGLNDVDLAYLIQDQGLSLPDLLIQADCLGQSHLSVILEKPCTPGDGILILNSSDKNRLSSHYREQVRRHGAHRFVPASGAASRLFAALDWYRHLPDAPSVSELRERAETQAEAKACLAILTQLDRYPFQEPLRQALHLGSDNLSEALERLGPKAVIDALLGKPGLGLAELPKALIPFHAESQGIATALDEQARESAALVEDENGLCRVHFTVSPEHLDLMQAACDRAAGELAKGQHRLQAEFSVQSGATRTLSLSGESVVREKGQPALRPGGHGALLGNLEGVGGSLVFVKNIDNVVRAEALEEGLPWRMAMAGLLLEWQGEAHDILRRLESENRGKAVTDGLRWLSERFGLATPEAVRKGDEDIRAQFCLKQLYRPMRVCGMVRNQGEPGGGPFWVRDAEGQMRPQIVEAAQVRQGDAGQKSILQSATHFNPVDFVCGLRDHRGAPYHLADYSDSKAWFLTEKAKDGKPLKVLERPGLWNGSMAHWLTVFVEIPVSLFNPVKTISDLLRPSHQG